MKKKTVLLIILLVLVGTFVGSVSFFSYLKIGSKESSIQIGDLTFKYIETDGKGSGISLNDAFPLSDTEGKALSNTNEYFDFRVEANLTRSDLEYTVELDTTLSDIPDSGIKVYLTEIVDNSEVEINSVVNLLSSYQTSTKGKIIYRETIPRNTKNYVKNFRLRIWIDENVDWTSEEYMDHSATYKVNIYANSDTSIAASDVVTDKTTTIERVVANNMYLFTTSSDQDVDYEVTVPYTVNNIDLEVFESNTKATSVTTKLNSLEGVSSKLLNQNISTGNNYFKTVVTASDGITSDEYILKVVKEGNPDNNLLNLGVENYSLSPSFDPNITDYSLTLEEPSIVITGQKSAEEANINGLGEKTLSFGENTFDVVVTPEDTNTKPKTYTITVNNERPTEPTIVGDGTKSSNWVKTAPTIRLAEDNKAFAISGIDYYEVYLGDSKTPADDVVATATTQDEYQVTKDGEIYVYYRTVSKKGFKSKWSNPIVVYVDMSSIETGTLSSAPSSANSITANYTAASSASGIKATNCYYGTNNNSTTIGTVSGNNCVFSGLAANTTYYFKKCVTNNVDVTACTIVSSKLTAGQVYNYGYNGGIQTFTTPYNGTYRLEVWGAQGGSISGYSGGYGGYAMGTKHLSQSQPVYIVVGGAGNGASGMGQSLSGGYNGGGSVTGNGGVNHINASGGGATHMALSSGVLSALSGNRSSVLLVAGGGGGARNQENHEVAARWGNGGAGGGTQSSGAYSNNGTTTVTQSPYCIATQSAGYSFGLGESATGNSAGGGGYMGGYSGSGACGVYLGSGSGGSGYTGGVDNGTMQNGARSGHGYARVTIVTID